MRTLPVQATPALAFNPAQITISPGDSVTFVFGSVAHNVTFQQESQDAAAYYAGRTSSRGAPTNIPTTANAAVVRVFPTVGSFEYRCSIHPGMLGEVKAR
jgi:plastocyanin